MHNWWKSGVLTVLLARSTSAIVERTLDLFPDSTWSSSHEPGDLFFICLIPLFEALLVISVHAAHNALSLPSTGPKNRLRTLRLLDDRGAREGGESRIDPSRSFRQPDREMEGDEVDQPAAKRQQLHLDLTLGPAAWGRGAAPPGSSNSRSQIRQHGGSSHPIYRICEDNDSNHALEQPSQAGDSAPYNKNEFMTLGASRGIHEDKLNSIDASKIPAEHTKDRFRTADRDMRVFQTNLVNGETSSARGFDSEIRSESWAWLSIILNHSRRLMNNESKATYIKLDTRRLIEAYFPYHIRRGKKGEEESFKNQRTKTRLSKMTELLWIANYYTLKNLQGASVCGSRYIEEQTRLQEWFLELLSRCKKYMMTPPTEQSGDEGRIYQQMRDAILAKVDITTYQIYQNGLTEKPILVTKPQMLMDESVFSLLGYYYKSMSKERWSSILRNDKNFMSQPDIPMEIMNKSLEGLNNGSQRLQSQYWTAWKAFSSEGFLKSIPFFSDLIQVHQFGYHVKPIYNERNIAEMEKLNIVRDFDANNLSDQNWAWIARVKFNKDSRFEKLFQPTTDTIMNEVRTYLIEITGKDLNPGQRARLAQTSVDDIFKKLDQIFDIIWGLNEKLSDIFGCELLDEEYISGQKAVQVFLLSCFSDQAKVQQSRNTVEIIQNNQVPPKVLIRGRIANLMVDLLILEKNEPRFTSTPTSHSTNASILHEDDLIFGQIAVNILGYYYKNKNHSKYLFHFGQDSWFFNFLISRGTNIFHKFKSYGNGRYEDYKIFKNFPWENPIDENMPG
ncbi:hypothetical protein MJO29_003251, partial [Puccinia striiformis f. sp. tritici]